jgi:nucleotide-binding universal stress UspA family protein
LPTDGSRLSDRAVRRGLRLAATVNARVTVVHVLPEYYRLAADEGMISPLGVELKKRIEKDSREYAAKLLGRIGARARAEGLRCEIITATGDAPYRQIIATARRRRCDLIIMASHGRTGLSSLLLGSETAKVLAHSKIPVMVVR